MTIDSIKPNLDLSDGKWMGNSLVSLNIFYTDSAYFVPHEGLALAWSKFFDSVLCGE